MKIKICTKTEITLEHQNINTYLKKDMKITDGRYDVYLGHQRQSSFTLFDVVNMYLVTQRKLFIYLSSNSNIFPRKWALQPTFMGVHSPIN
jgi:hypothetical protein